MSFFEKILARLLSAIPFLRDSERIPLFSALIDKQHDRLLDSMQESIKPYQDKYRRNFCLPEDRCSREEVLSILQQIKADEDHLWRDGFASGTVYHGDEEHIAFLNQVYALCSQSNPLHSDIWPSINKFEAEIVSMTAAMLGAAAVQDTKVGGSVTSGGSESIMLAMKTYRDWARKEKGIKRPEAVIPVSAHAAFDKACHYFSIKKVSIPLSSDFRASLAAARRAIGRNTIVMVGSAPSFPHGIIDPLEEMAELAKARGIGLHVDACLGGFLLPWVEESFKVPPFDFRIAGVSSISVDTHKFGYASKGSSVLLFRDGNLRHHQYFTSTDWPGGLYFSPTFAGSRPGALIAQCWAAMLTMGQEGYRKATREIVTTAAFIKDEVRSIPGLELLGDPLWVIAFTSRDRNIYDIMEQMRQRGWSLNGLHRPSCLHLCTTLRHTQAGVAERFVRDLRQAVHQAGPIGKKGRGMAPVYGMAAQIPLRGVVSRFLKKYMDRLYEV